MSPQLHFERVPIESRQPVVSFAVIRALIVGSAIAALAILGFPYGGDATAVLVGVLLPWSLFAVYVARRWPDAALNPLVAVVDFAALGLLLAVEPDTYGQVHFAALFMVGAHAHFQGEQRGLLVGAMAPLVLVPVSAAVDVPIGDGMLEAYEALFAACSLAMALVVGSLRTAESSGRLRARQLARTTIDTESEVRKHLAEAIHDGPIQELSSVELMLASAAQAFERGDTAQGHHALSEARAVTRDNITFLRDEIVELGPHAFEERRLSDALNDCVETWQRRHGFTVTARVEADDLPAEIAGALFRVTQEAVTNAGKHGQAKNVAISVTRVGDAVELDVTDDGEGFGDVDPLGPAEPGHIGLASMRERAEMLGGRLAIESRNGGTSVRVNVPL